MDTRELVEVIKKTDGIDSFTTDQAFAVMKKFVELVRASGLDEKNPKDISAAFTEIFNIEVYNLPNVENGRFILTPNHISEFDGPIWGVRHANMLVVAKKEWTDERLNKFLGQFFIIFGVDRSDEASKVSCLRACIKHLRDNENGIVTIFPQQTIADINNCGTEDIALGPCLIQKKSNAVIIPVFCEQPSFDRPTRIVYGDPLNVTSAQEFGEVWLKEEMRLQNSLEPKARKPVLSFRHSIPISKRGFRQL